MFVNPVEPAAVDGRMLLLFPEEAVNARCLEPLDSFCSCVGQVATMATATLGTRGQINWLALKSVKNPFFCNPGNIGYSAGFVGIVCAYVRAGFEGGRDAAADLINWAESEEKGRT